MSATIARCERCRGQKDVMGLGMLMQKCPNCKGIGFVSSEPTKIADVMLDAERENVLVVKKPRGVPKGYKRVKKEPVLQVSQLSSITDKLVL